MPGTPDEQRALDRWRTHLRLVEQAMNEQDRLWQRAQDAHDQRRVILYDEVPTWRRRCWSHPHRWVQRWARLDQQRWERRTGLLSQTLFLHDWRRTLDALPAWMNDGARSLAGVDPSLAESFWDRWRVQGVFLLDGLLESHPHRRGNVMPFRGLRHTLRSAQPGHRPPFVQALIDGKTLGTVLAALGAQDLGRVDAQGYTPLHHAVLAERLDVVQALVAQGADVNRPLAHRGTVETPLFLAALVGAPELLQGLLDLGAQPNGLGGSQDRWYSPLHVAAQSGHASAVQRLLDAGADPHRQDPSGLRPVDLAGRNGYDAIVATLRAIERPGGPGQDPLGT